VLERDRILRSEEMSAVFLGGEKEEDRLVRKRKKRG
jgi:hypothetical protein